MKKFINVYIKSDYDIVILRLSVIIIFMLFGTYKWFDFEVMALKPLDFSHVAEYPVHYVWCSWGAISSA